MINGGFENLMPKIIKIPHQTARKKTDENIVNLVEEKQNDKGD